MGEIRRILDETGQRYVLLERFGLDIAIWRSSEDSVTVSFIELKVYSGARQGGVGFGNVRGEGVQVDILINEHSQLMVLDPSTRWILADATLPAGSARYTIVSSTEIKGSAMGSVARGKQNNFRIAEVRRHALTWPVLTEQLRRFLLRKAAVQGERA